MKRKKAMSALLLTTILTAIGLIIGLIGMLIYDPQEKSGRFEIEDLSEIETEDEAKRLAEKDIEKARQICSVIRSDNRRAWCYGSISMKTPDIKTAKKICQEIEETYYRDSCLIDIASGLDDTDEALEICILVDGDDSKKICRAKANVKTDFDKARNICSEIEDEQEKERCDMLILEESIN